jgi:squalene synthase HpnC
MEAVRPSAQLPSAEAVLAKAPGENFPVASKLLPRQVRAHLLALYAFARLVDDVGDEAGDRAPELLEWIERDLDRVYGGTPENPVMRRLAATVRECNLPREPFARLIEANRRDQVVTRYETFDDLLGYCELSANPVGCLVLEVFGAASPERVALSDRVCSALQLVEHWQDVKEDAERGRVYLPREDLERFGVADGELAADSASDRFRHLIAFEVARTRELLRAGARLVGTLHGRLRLAVAGFVAGGEATLRAIERLDYDVMRSTPRATPFGFARGFGRALMGR